ncbi:MAG TPA: nucleotidyltransferase [Bacillota bacterium]|nr:nucleotidyltransferase [Bacillota bacterium]
MRVLGLVVEYNPFHNGHLHHLQQARIACAPDLTVAVMSGNFTQRGEPAIMDKWARTEIALSLGVDLVLELPTAWAVRSAGDFAMGAILHLQSFGVTHLCFGSESNDLVAMMRLAREQNRESVTYRATLHRNLSQGSTFARAKAAALEESTGLAISAPNDILGMAYLAALEKLSCPIVPVAIKRIGSGYHDTDYRAAIASATAIRRGISHGGILDNLPIPAKTLEIIRRESEIGRAPIFWDAFTEPLRYQLRRLSASELATLPDMEVGLPHRLANLPGVFPDIEDLVTQIKTKRYTWTRLQRILVYTLLGLTADKLKQIHSAGPTYLRVLGLRRDKSHLLNDLARTLPLVYTPSELPDDPSMRLDAFATDVYAMGFPELSQRHKGQDYTRQVVVR